MNEFAPLADLGVEDGIPRRDRKQMILITEFNWLGLQSNHSQG